MYNSKPQQDKGLNREHFQPLMLRGWNQDFSDYLYSMAWFEGKLYCGNMRGSLLFIKQRNPPPDFSIYPIPCPENPFNIDVRAQIWCYTPETKTWEMVYQSPMVTGRFGDFVPREVGYRGMVVFQGKSDPKPTLYVSTLSPTRSTGPVILRSEDGHNFEIATDSGLGLNLKGLKSFRFLEIFNGKLYTSPIGGDKQNIDPTKFANSVVNSSGYPIIFETDDPRSGKWRPVSPPNFGNSNNVVVFYATAFNGFFYASTFNWVSGFQIWKTKGEGEVPYQWTKVLQLGAYRGKLNQGVIWMCPFKGALYACTGIQDGGYDRNNKIGPAAGEVIRIYPDDSWDLVVGTPRITPQGLKIPTSGMRPGFNNFFNGYLWQMAVYEDHLYLGTMDWSIYLRYCSVEKWHPAFRKILIDAPGGIEAVIADEGGCDLWKTQDGNHWSPVTRTGFENPFNCGIRKLFPTPLGLMVGTVNGFGPQVAAKINGEWEYVDNPRGGCEVWLGKIKPNNVQKDLLDPIPTAPVILEPPSIDPIKVKSQSSSSLDLQPQVLHDSTLPSVPSNLIKPPYRRIQRCNLADFDLTQKQLRSQEALINLNEAAPQFLEFTKNYHQLEVVGHELIPKAQPRLFICNHTGTPLLINSSVLPEVTLLLAHLLPTYIGQPVRILMGVNHYTDELLPRVNAEMLAKLGCVPATLNNGIQLLKQGKDILIFPEGEESLPPYQTLPFFWDFAKIAWITDVPIVPMAFVGPHESRLRVDCDGAPIVFVPQLKPNPVVYRLMILAPIYVRQYISSIKDKTALSQFCEMVHQRIQSALDREVGSRKLTQVAQQLQNRYNRRST